MSRPIVTLLCVLGLAMEPARAEIVWSWEDGFSDAEKAKLSAWVRQVVDGIEELVAPYPFDIHVSFYRADRGDSPVPWANTIRSRRQGVNFHVDPERTTDEFLEDWTAPHELSHLLIPYVGRRNAWFAEGFASYMQYQVMHAMRIIDDGQMEQRYRTKIGEARRRYDLHEQAFTEAAATLVARREYPTMYWGGALYFLQVDRLLRQRGTTVLGVLRQFVDCCRSGTRGFDALLVELDRIAGEPVFSERLDALRTRSGFPDEAGVWSGDD